MKRLALALFAAALSQHACSCTSRVISCPAPEPTDIALFSGQDLTGWIQRGGNATYAVEDGCIVGRTAPNQPNSFLCTTGDYTDFVLTLEFKVDDALNSGVQIRSRSTSDHEDGRVHGYQVEIDPSDRSWTGGIYDEGRRGWLDDLADNETARAAFRRGEWNSMRVEAVGDRIRTWINGVPCADLRDDMTPSGFIALQVHGVGSRTDPLEVRWRRITLTHLPAEPANPGASPDASTTPSNGG